MAPVAIFVGHYGLEPGQGFALDDGDVPGLEVAAGCGSGCFYREVVEECGIDRGVEEASDGAASGDGFGHVHGFS